MPTMNFDEVPDSQLLPEGWYNCQVSQIQEKNTSNGSLMWQIEFVVISGEFQGWKVWDNLVWTTNAFPRIKKVCAAMGLKTSGTVELVPSHLIQRRCRVKVFHETYQGEKRAKVPFSGYEQLKAAQPAVAQPAAQAAQPAQQGNQDTWAETDEIDEVPF